ncbi:MAG: glycosyltransferase family 2 protein [Planctomycetes bacterium]|nr:glycosyltransferase family 2 protein [Planctomycetota bacterium]
MPQVSVIMPSYNHGLYIAEAIRSVLTQSFTDLELIIIDDASTDNSPAIIRSLQQQDSRVKATFHETNQLLAKTVNDGFAQAQGQFLCILTSDDIYPQERIAHQVQLATQPELRDKVIVGDYVNVDNDSNIVPDPFAGPTWNQYTLKRHGDILESLLDLWMTYIGFQTLFLNQNHVAQVRFDERFPLISNELKFALDLAGRFQFHKMDELVFIHRIHDQNLSRRGETDMEHLVMVDKEKRIIAQDMLAQHPHRLPASIRAKLQQFIMSCSESYGNPAVDKQYFLDFLRHHPSALNATRAAVKTLPTNRIPYPFRKDNTQLTLAEIGISVQDIMQMG